LNNLSDTYKILFGAIIALSSSIIIECLKIRINKKQEVDFFKATLLEDISEICELIHDMRETFRKTQTLSNEYLNELLAIENKFSSSRHDKLYLIKDDNLRYEIKTLFKNLNTKIKESANRVNSLGPANQNHNNIITDFDYLETRIKATKINIEKHKYCVFWIF
jgi:hypothetical protein